MELAGAASPQPPESNAEPPRPPPQPPEKDSSKGTGDMVNTEEKPCTDQETELGQTDSSSLNCSSECDNLTPSNDQMTGSESEAAKTGGDELNREKVLKKPDKILPCPRCHSMDTKFCYYNNYNIKQPRHFCKSCQRYWTAGGSMRNIPVGAGKRKSKSSSSNCRSILIPGSSLAPPVGDASLYPLSIKGSQAAVKFGPDSPLCNSMADVLEIGEQSNNVNPASTVQPRNGETQNCTPSTSDSPQSEPLKGAAGGHQNGIIGQCNGINFMHPIPCFPGPPFVYPWSPAWNGIPAMTAPVCSAPAEAANSSEHGNTSNVQWSVPPMVPVMPPGFCGPAMPPSVWPFITHWPNGAWSPPWLGPNSSLSASSPISSSTRSDGGSPVLGKHSRDLKPQGDDKSERCLWIPKTLRIDDPDEAAKSSIWTTLGIEPGERGMFRPFQSKPESREQISGAARVLQANPAAMSRSQSFQETT